MQERLIPLEGTYNFRDFGGYPAAGGTMVKRRTLYRSDNLSQLSPRAFARFASLGIRLLVDLRTEYESVHRPNATPPGLDLRVERLPISIAPELEKKWSNLEKAWFMLSGRMERLDLEYTFDLYRRLVENAAPALARLFELLLDPGAYPVLILCMAGRDRTGFAAAMVLSALGVPLETVLEDYCLTDVYAAKSMDRMVRTMRALSLFRTTSQTIRQFFAARPEYLRSAIEAIESAHGSVEAYLRDRAGLTDASRTTLRSLLLER